MVSEIRIYFEGGRRGKDLKTKLRKGFNSFFSEIIERVRSQSIHWHFAPCYSRNEAFEDFQLAQRTYPDAFNILLVDSEGLVMAEGVWNYLNRLDGWATKKVEDDHYHLMVQMMESWFLADKEVLQKYYGRDFRMNALRGNPNVEDIPKKDVESCLKDATRPTQKGEYDKIRHGPEIFGLLRAQLVKEAAPYCKRLFETLQRITEQ
jgi:hypothetical protein